MPLFVVTYTHPDEAGWRLHVTPHVEYLNGLVERGVLRASGPFKDTPHRSAMLLFAAPDRDALMALIAEDPFAIEGLIEDMTVTEWDPIFGALIADSSRAV